MSHNSKNQDRWGIPDVILGDTHFAMGNHGQRLADNAQLMAYATAAGVDHVTFVSGGDLMHHDHKKRDWEQRNRKHRR